MNQVSKKNHLNNKYTTDNRHLNSTMAQHNLFLLPPKPSGPDKKYSGFFSKTHLSHPQTEFNPECKYKSSNCFVRS